MADTFQEQGEEEQLSPHTTLVLRGTGSSRANTWKNELSRATERKVALKRYEYVDIECCKS